MVSRKASAAKRTKLGDKLLKKSTAASKKAAVDAGADAAAAVEAQMRAPDGGATTSGDEVGKVLYIGHLPHGFYEQQLKGYFSQFGAVTRVRVSRNKKTARARHYAFLEFASADVARAAADAMDGYLMFSSRLACRVVPPARVHPALFKGANRTFTRVPWRKIEADRHNAARGAEADAKRVARAVGRDRRRAARIAATGMDYTYDPLVPGTPPSAAEEAAGAAASEAAAAAAAAGSRKRAAPPAAAPAPKVKAVAAKRAAAPTVAKPKGAAAAAAPKRKAAAAAEKPAPKKKAAAAPLKGGAAAKPAAAATAAKPAAAKRTRRG